MAGRIVGEKNFWLWGTWGKRAIKAPFLTQKVSSKIRNVVIGQTFIVVLQEDGKLVSWGEDKVGCLGLGTEMLACPDPHPIQIPGDGNQVKIIDIQHGKHHILALASNGKVYSWGDNQAGQLGLNDTQGRYEPVFVEELRTETVVQILAVDNMSYALTNHGVVHAWGDNKEGALALEHDNPRVLKPEPMMRMKDTIVKKLEIKEAGGQGGGKGGKTIIAYVELADPLPVKDQIGGYPHPLGESQKDAKPEEGLSDSNEKDIFEGVDLMRRVMDNTQEWWHHMLDVRHGSPYDDNPMHYNPEADRGASEDNCTPLQLDTFVSLDNLEKASYELDMLIQSAKAQLLEIKQKRGTKNVKFMLSMFMDDCKLRREKIRRTVAARQLVDYKKAIGQDKVTISDLGGEGEINRLTLANKHLERTLKKVQNLRVYDVFTKHLQESIIECIEQKMITHQTQVEALESQGKDGKTADILRPPLKMIKERWGALKRFSVYTLYQELAVKQASSDFHSDDEMLAFLVQRSDSFIDSQISMDRNAIISRDHLVPPLCYDLLVENAELRKMCNTYQLKVLLMRQGKDRPGQ